MNFTIKPYILCGEKQQGNFDYLFAALENDSVGERLENNYKGKMLHLDKMYNFNFLVNGNDPILVSGSQICSPNVCRVFSRYYVFKKFRTNNQQKLLNKIDNFFELQYTMETLQNKFKLIIWSRDKSVGFFKKLKKQRSDLFYNWKVYDKPIELMYKNNYQFIFYTSDISYLNEVMYDNH